MLTYMHTQLPIYIQISPLDRIVLSAPAPAKQKKSVGCDADEAAGHDVDG